MIELRYPAPVPPWTTNDERRMHWAAVGKRVQAWKFAARVHAQSQHLQDLPPSTISMSITYPTNRIRDPHNLVGTILKATIDGLVDAGCWPDDNPKWVHIHEPTISIQPGPHLVTVTIEPL
jgi:crossover junction endodeoxyribonuclease RusA